MHPRPVSVRPPWPACPRPARLWPTSLRPPRHLAGVSTASSGRRPHICGRRLLAGRSLRGTRPARPSRQVTPTARPCRDSSLPLRPVSTRSRWPLLLQVSVHAQLSICLLSSSSVRQINQRTTCVSSIQLSKFICDIAPRREKDVLVLFETGWKDMGIIVQSTPFTSFIGICAENYAHYIGERREYKGC